MKMETCRKCPARIVWLYTKNQKPIPVDAETVKEGDVEFDASRHITHFKTCAFAKDFRKPKEPKTEKQKAPAAAQQRILL